MRLGVAIALWKRPALTRLVLRHWARMRVPGAELVLCAIGSPGDGLTDPGSGALPAPWRIMGRAANSPLSDKHNALVRAMEPLDLDAVMVSGSDDLITADYVREAARLAALGKEMIRPVNVFIGCLLTGRMVSLPITETGAGRVLSRALLERAAWQPWPAGLETGLDGGAARHLPYDPARTYYLNAAGRIVDLKSRPQRWSLRHLMRHSGHWQEEDFEAHLKEHFPDVASKVFALRDHHMKQETSQLGAVQFRKGGRHQPAQIL